MEPIALFPSPLPPCQIWLAPPAPQPATTHQNSLSGPPAQIISHLFTTLIQILWSITSVHLQSLSFRDCMRFPMHSGTALNIVFLVNGILSILTVDWANMHGFVRTVCITSMKYSLLLLLKFSIVLLKGSSMGTSVTWQKIQAGHLLEYIFLEAWVWNS